MTDYLDYPHLLLLCMEDGGTMVMRCNGYRIDCRNEEIVFVGWFPSRRGLEPEDAEVSSSDIRFVEDSREWDPEKEQTWLIFS